MDIFIYDKDTYQSKRDFDMLHHYIENMAFGLAKLENIDVEVAKAFIIEKIKDGTLGYKDPEVKMLKRDENDDKHRAKTTMSQYLKTVQENRYIIAPTFTVYYHPNQKRSEISVFTEMNVTTRNVAKKKALVYKQEGKALEASLQNNVQLAAKLNNNLSSGAFVSRFNMWYNRSAHSSLTSVCRTCASFANINNERFMLGYRHFYSVNVVIENIISVLKNMNYDECQRIIDKYNLHILSKEEFRECIEYSSQYYFRGKKLWKKIDAFIDTLTPLERTIYFYTADFYHLRKFNDGLVREYFRKIINIDVSEIVDNPTEVMERMDEDMTMLSGILMADKLNFKGITSPETKAREDLPNLMSGVDKLMSNISEWQDLIECFWRNDCLPHDTAEMPSMVRDCVLGGDTDSTLFTVVNWAEWYRGQIDDSRESMCVAQTITYFTSMMVRHYLAYVSAIIGVPRKYLYMMAMKNEFMFPVFITTRRTKNYIATICAQEGNVYKEFEQEVKGPVLKGGKLPRGIAAELDKMIEEVMDVVWTKRQVSIRYFMDKIANIEYSIFSSIVNGETEYLQKADIKKKEVYAVPMSSNYASYDLWQNVFARKYGEIQGLPLSGIKINLDTSTRATTNAWLSRIRDGQIREGIRNWLDTNGKQAITSVVLPIDLIAQNGIPSEFHSAINFRKIIYGLTEGFYVLLESLGIYMVNKNNTRLVLDTYPHLFKNEEMYMNYLSNSFDTDFEDE